MRVHPGSCRNNQARCRFFAHGGQPCLCRHVIPYIRNAQRRIVGKGSMGRLLELGPERNLGRHNMGNLPYLHTFPHLRQTKQPVCQYYCHLRISRPANVLVRCELPAVRPKQPAFVLIFAQNR